MSEPIEMINQDLSRTHIETKSKFVVYSITTLVMYLLFALKLTDPCASQASSLSAIQHKSFAMRRGRS